MEMKLVDEDGNEVPQGEVGEILVRGPTVMKGYWNRDEATAETLDADGWLRTGDMGTMDEDGYYSVVDRKKEMIIRGGFNVYPREIEEAMYEHEAVREVAVIGVPHPSLGEEVVAAVALRPGAEITPEELRDFAKSRVGRVQVPAAGVVRRRAPEGADRQDPQAGDRGAGGHLPGLDAC
jgi:long-chain acyl-CoA synthetase